MDPNPELTHLYSCSRWSVKDPNEVISEYISEGEKACQELRLRPHIEDLPYEEEGSSDMAKVDIWGEVKDHLVVFVHGGYWQEGNRKLVSPAALSLIKHGIAMASVGYDYASISHPLDEVIRQVTTAVKFLLNHYPQVKSWTLAGHSAGAQLAYKVYAHLRSPRIQRLALFAGVYNLEDLSKCEIGMLIGLTPEVAQRSGCNAMELLGTGVKVLLMVALKDSPKLIEQNRNMAKSMKDLEIAVHYEEFPDCDHFNLIHGLSREEPQIRELLSFLQETVD